MKRKTILLVEDNPDEAELALLAFKRINGPYQIHVAANGETALDFLSNGGQTDRENQPSLVLLDINLPKISGFDVLKRLRADNAYRQTPVVILTTSDEHSDLLRGYQAGANSFLCKPMDFDSFMDLLEQVAERWLSAD